MNKKAPQQSKRKGSIIAFALLAIVILLATGVGLLGLGLHSRIFAVRTTSDIAARCAADAGLVKAVFKMNEKLKVKPWSDSNLPYGINETLWNFDAVFSYTITGDSDSGYIVDSIGQFNKAKRTVCGVLLLQGPFEYAIFTHRNIGFKYGGTVGWYNYKTSEKNFSIGTNSIESDSINLKNGATVNGNVVVGFGGNPDEVINDKGATITGNTYAATERYDLPPVTVPEQLQELPSQGTIEESTIITSSGKYDGINLFNSEIIKIDGSVKLYVSGDIILDNSAELQVVDVGTNPDASLTLYLGGDIEVKNGSSINNMSEDPKKTRIYGLDSCQNIILKNSSNFYGAIYAPNADVEMKNTADAYGAVVANSFEQKNSATFYYDASLREADTDDELVRFVIKRWSEE